uniref:Uncharacterized protein n=1 Tax=Zea mays TaxID=4577 RepID=A0A804NXJ3_MAIZE
MKSGPFARIHHPPHEIVPKPFGPAVQTKHKLPAQRTAARRRPPSQFPHGSGTSQFRTTIPPAATADGDLTAEPLLSQPNCADPPPWRPSGSGSSSSSLSGRRPPASPSWVATTPPLASAPAKLASSPSSAPAFSSPPTQTAKDSALAQLSPASAMPADIVVIRLPGPRALRVLARSVLFAVALLFLPWLRPAEAPARGRAVDTCGAAAAQAELLLRDLHQEGLPVHGARAVVLVANGVCDSTAPKQDLRRMLMIGESSVDFLLDFGYFNEDADSLPQNYRTIYIHRFAEAFIGVKKVAPAEDNSHAGTSTRTELLSPPAFDLKEGVFYSRPDETTNCEFKNMARKLLLSDITGTPTAYSYKRKLLVQMLRKDQES